MQNVLARQRKRKSWQNNILTSGKMNAICQRLTAVCLSACLLNHSLVLFSLFLICRPFWLWLVLRSLTANEAQCLATVQQMHTSGTVCVCYAMLYHCALVHWMQCCRDTQTLLVCQFCHSLLSANVMNRIANKACGGAIKHKRKRKERTEQPFYGSLSVEIFACTVYWQDLWPMFGLLMPRHKTTQWQQMSQ